MGRLHPKPGLRTTSEQLGDPNAHLTVYGRNDYTDPETLTRGYPVSDLTALVVLDALRQMGIRD